MSRKPVLTTDTVRAAIERAKAGKGRQLALLIKSCSTDDLAKAFSCIGPHYKDTFDEGVFLAGLSGVLAFVEGRNNARGELTKLRKDVRAEFRAKRKRERELVETSCRRDADIADRFDAIRPLRDDLDHGREA